jgi:hypothetical protein
MSMQAPSVFIAACAANEARMRLASVSSRAAGGGAGEVIGERRAGVGVARTGRQRHCGARALCAQAAAAIARRRYRPLPPGPPGLRVGGKPHDQKIAAARPVTSPPPRRPSGRADPIGGADRSGLAAADSGPSLIARFFSLWFDSLHRSVTTSPPPSIIRYIET